MSTYSTQSRKLQIDVPAYSTIRAKTQEILGRRPCYWQIQVAAAILRGDKDVVCVSATRTGKTLTFWMPLIFCPEGIQVIITPLNLLGAQNREQLDALGIQAIAIDGRTATRKNLQVSSSIAIIYIFSYDLPKDISEGKYRVVVINPEIAFGNAFEKIWKNNAFASRLVSVIWDEAHCVSDWSKFRKDYQVSGSGSSFKLFEVCAVPVRRVNIKSHRRGCRCCIRIPISSMRNS